MKTVIYVILVLAFYTEAYTQWESAGLQNTTVAAFASTASDLYAGTGYGIYRATNNGTNWVPSGINSYYISSIAVTPGKIYAVRSTLPGVYVSTNNGLSFTDIGLNSEPCNVIAVRDSFVYASFNGYGPGLYVTSNNGANWTLTLLFNEFAQAIAIKDNYMYGGTLSHGFFYSTDYGVNWTRSELNNRTVKSIAVNGNNIYAATEIGGVYLSSNNGVNWSQTSMNNKSIFSIVSYGNFLFAGTFGEGVYLSTDNGATWLQKNAGLGNLYINAFVVFNDYVYAGTNNGIWRRSLQEIISVNNISEGIPGKYELKQNYPNPFNPVTTIQYAIPKESRVTIRIYDVTGREAGILVNEIKKAGCYLIKFNGSGLSSGIYFYKIEARDFVQTRRMVLIK